MVNNNSFYNLNRTFCIAEIGINHNGDLKLGMELITAAKRAGADAVKFQTYLTEKRVPKSNKKKFDILKKCELSHEDFSSLKQHADEEGIDFFSTAFDEESIEILENIGVETYKIASIDVSNTSLLRAVAETRKNVIFSTGMATLDEIDNAKNILSLPDKKLGILHCVSSYPLPVDGCNLSNIHKLKELYKCRIGYSDHTKTIEIPSYAVCAGASIIEKHFYLGDNHDCIDEPVSISEKQFYDMVNNIRNLEKIISTPDFGIKDIEKGTVASRRIS